jgi:hypothetical protein
MRWARFASWDGSTVMLAAGLRLAEIAVGQPRHCGSPTVFCRCMCGTSCRPNLYGRVLRWQSHHLSAAWSHCTCCCGAVVGTATVAALTEKSNRSPKHVYSSTRRKAEPGEHAISQPKNQSAFESLGSMGPGSGLEEYRSPMRDPLETNFMQTFEKKESLAANYVRLARTN